MPTWMGSILQTYEVYREERVRIRNSDIDCRMRIYDNLQYQSIVRFERIVSGRFSPLTTPHPLPRPPAPPYFFKSRSRSSVFGPAPLHFPLLLCSHVLSLSMLSLYVYVCTLRQHDNNVALFVISVIYCPQICMN